MALAFGLAAIEVQYYLALFILCLFLCLLINFSNNVWRVRYKPGAPEKHWVPSAYGPAAASIILGSGEVIIVLGIQQGWSYYFWMISLLREKMELVSTQFLVPAILFPLKISTDLMFFHLKKQQQTKWKHKLCNFFNLSSWFETENIWAQKCGELFSCYSVIEKSNKF